MLAVLTEQVKMKEKDNDHIKKKSVQTSSACDASGIQAFGKKIFKSSLREHLQFVKIVANSGILSQIVVP